MRAVRAHFERAVIVLSTGRTGTMALARFLNARCPGVTAVHEPRPSRILRLASNRYLCGHNSRPRLRLLYRLCRRDLFAAVRTPVYVEANNFLHGFNDVLDDLFGEPLVVHLVRDPRTFVRSWINFGVFRGVKGATGRWFPHWLLKPEQYRPESGLVWAQMEPVARLAWYWSVVNGELERGAALFGPRYLRIRYEDLFAASGAELQRFLAAARLSVDGGGPRSLQGETVNPSRRHDFPPWRDWPPAWQAAVLSHCAERMARYGYT